MGAYAIQEKLDDGGAVWGAITCVGAVRQKYLAYLEMMAIYGCQNRAASLPISNVNGCSMCN